jgi:pilus assembly protein CpaC
VKVLAEPTIMAISGQEASFLAGGKIFIPVSQSNSNGVPTITLEEKEFGVGVKFTPTVLEGGRINLKVLSEVSDLNKEGVGITATGISTTAILPSFTTRRAATTVQLYDGQSFAIGGLIKNNVTTNIKALPVLGEVPVLGALFRSSDFQTDRSELVFIITPHLVKPLPPDYSLPTDPYIQPSRAEFFLGGKMEGSAPPEEKTPAGPATGFEVK